jgi:ribosomal protein S3AE
MAKTTKVLSKRRKFQEVEVPLIRSNFELIGNSVEELNGRTMELDLTRQLKGKSVEATFKVKIENKKAIAYPIKIKLMPYFIRRMIRKSISYVEDSFFVKSKESLLLIKPFLITRKKVSKSVRRTIRNKAKNWIEDYSAERDDSEIFSEVLSNRMQKPLSLALKKTYPLSLCEIRIIEIKRPLRAEEVPKVVKKKIIEKELDEQIEEFETEKIKDAESEIKKTQDKASEKEKESDEGLKEESQEKEETTKKIKKEKVKTEKKEPKEKSAKKKSEKKSKEEKVE